MARKTQSNLVIVESPSKAKTIQKYLGPGYEVVATRGHVRDLPKSKIGVDIEHDFTPSYVLMTDKKDLVKKLKDQAAKSKAVYLATDPDREGEAISWHLAQLLSLNLQDQNRVTFNAVTKSSVITGMEHPRSVDLDLVDAQQARRVLDRIVGYKLSPFLWKKVRRGLSAGRVQSVAVRLIVDREEEIRAFVSVEYWSIDAKLQKKGDKTVFGAYLYGTKDGKKLQVENGEQAQQIVAALDGAQYVVAKIKKGARKRQPAPPFITSTLQQEASRKLGFTGKRTMKAAQELYEGVEVPKLGTTGLITYMRTDSSRISDEARQQGNDFIRKTYGDNYLPPKPRVFKQKASAQDGHEAIRPTMPSLRPEKLEGVLTGDQFKLYKLIWERFMASLMADCLQNTMQVDIVAGDYLFRASGVSVTFDGFTVLYVEGKDDEEREGGALPDLVEGEVLKLKKLEPNQHFTQPPPRYTEATLIKALEENGIGRPSTYAPTISTILARDYVEREKKTFKPTPLGEVTTQLMKDMFKEIVDVKFTATVEDELDEVEKGKLPWVSVLEQFYGRFSKTLETAEKKLDGTRIKVPDEESDEVCELCGRKMVIKTGRFGKFLACPGYPECKNTKPLVQATDGECPKCGKRMIARKSKKGAKYFACEGGKECGFMTWNTPTKERCPKCGKTLFKKRGGILYCADEACGYEQAAQPKKTKEEESSNE